MLSIEIICGLNLFTKHSLKFPNYVRNYLFFDVMYIYEMSHPKYMNVRKWQEPGGLQNLYTSPNIIRVIKSRRV